MKLFILYLDIFWVVITCYSLDIKSIKSTCYGVAHSPEGKTDLQNLHILFAYTHTHTHTHNDNVEEEVKGGERQL